VLKEDRTAPGTQTLRDLAVGDLLQVGETLPQLLDLLFKALAYRVGLLVNLAAVLDDARPCRAPTSPPASFAIWVMARSISWKSICYCS
jgi:hypothetical protein